MNYIAVQEDVKFFFGAKKKNFSSNPYISYQMLVNFWIGGINIIMKHRRFSVKTGGQDEKRLYGKGSLGRPEP